MQTKAAAESIFHAAIAAVQPSQLIPQYLQLEEKLLRIGGQAFPISTQTHLYVIGAGKASAAMAQAVEKLLLPVITDGSIAVKYEYGLPLQKIQCIEAGHPLPDENGVQAARKICLLADKATADDLVICLLSGGASALLADYPPSSSLAELQTVAELLLSCGATIQEINILRKHLSYLKGGQLARHVYPAALVSLILSDVVGDPLDSIASGPTVPDSSSFADAWAIVEQYELKDRFPPRLMHILAAGKEGHLPDTPKKDDLVFRRTYNVLIGNNQLALNAAAAKASTLGYAVQVISNTITGEARTVAEQLIKEALTYKAATPVCLLYGGETTVSLKGRGKGGRNQELALAASIALQNTHRSITLLSAGTDGTDGPTDAAGAIIDQTTYSKAVQEGIQPEQFLNNNDAYHFFEKQGGLIKTGPTHTNVMDVIVLLIE